MRVVQDSPDRLVIRDNPVVLGAVLGGFTVLLVGFALATWSAEPLLALGALVGAAVLGLCLAIFARQVFVMFDRPQGAVVIRSASVFGQTEAQIPLTDLVGAMVETTTSIDGPDTGSRRSLMYRPALCFTDGRPNLPLNQIYASGSSAAKVVAAVNRWMPAAPRA